MGRIVLVVALAVLTSCINSTSGGSITSHTDVDVTSAAEAPIDQPGTAAAPIVDGSAPPTPTGEPAHGATRANPRPVPIPELPADLATTTSSSPTTPQRHGADDGDNAAVSADDIGVAWIIARHTTRADDPLDERRRSLAGLAVNPALAAAVDAAVPRAGLDAATATWAIVDQVRDLGDGWWRIHYTLKQTAPGQVGPTSTPAVLDVHVTSDLLVDQERP